MDWKKLLDGWNALTTKNRVRIVVAVVATVGLVWGLSSYATRARYELLFSRLSQDDAGAILSELRDRQVPYRISAAGSAIEVPSSVVAELRLELADQGLPTGGGVGFELFDQPSFGLSEFQQGVNYQRAMERELVRSIESLSVVERARVHLALAEESAFADEQTEPKATVVIQFRSAGGLPPDRVRGIRHLVASGVIGMQPERVSVVDSRGQLLSEPMDEDDVGMSASQLDAKRQLERGIESRLRSTLESMVGKGRVRVQANVELNMTRVEREDLTYDPNGAAVARETKDKAKQIGGGIGGVPGTASNLPGGAQARPQSDSRNESQKTTTDFVVSQSRSNISEPGGTMVRQTVSIIVDHDMVAPDENSDPVPTPRSDEELDKITRVARSAIGINENRGDELVVVNYPFDESATPSIETGGGFGLDTVVRILRQLSWPLAVLLLALFVIRPAFRTLRGLGQGGVEDGQAPPPTIAHLQAALRAGTAGQLADESPPLRRRLIEAAAQDPRAAALVVRGWLGDAARRD